MVDLFSNLSRESVMINKSVLVLCFAVLLGIAGCSRQQSDWEKTRTTNTIDAYEQFLKSYPSGEFTAQAQARVKELYEERDWQKARDADTLDAYQAFLKQYPEGRRKPASAWRTSRWRPPPAARRAPPHPGRHPQAAPRALRHPAPQRLPRPPRHRHLPHPRRPRFRQPRRQRRLRRIRARQALGHTGFSLAHINPAAPPPTSVGRN